jgi:hypothetical protein
MTDEHATSEKPNIRGIRPFGGWGSVGKETAVMDGTDCPVCDLPIQDGALIITAEVGTVHAACFVLTREGSGR